MERLGNIRIRCSYFFLFYSLATFFGSYQTNRERKVLPYLLGKLGGSSHLLTTYYLHSIVLSY